MQISREAILNKTHYGLEVYAHVLRQYYPNDTVLSLIGRVCKSTKNPFNKNKMSLKVAIIDNCARHTDSDNAIADGDAFAFAQLHYKIEGDELLEIINKELHLRLGEENKFYPAEKNKKTSFTSQGSAISIDQYPIQYPKGM